MQKNNDLFTDIARRHLQIDTLETRKSDSLDFHDCSVWGIKSALQEAFEAGRAVRNKSKPTPQREELQPAFLGIVEASYKDMLTTFGKPQKGDGYKTDVIWTAELMPGISVQIYNYKNSKSYDKAYPRIQSIRDWSVDGIQSDAIEWVKGMLGQQTK